MPATYDWSKTPKTYLDKSDRLGLLIGSILAGGMGAASGYGGGDSALRGVAGFTAGFGGGANALEDNYSKLIAEKMRRDQQEYENNMQNKEFEINKPYKEAATEWNEAMSRNLDFDNQMALQKMINEEVSTKKNERFDTRMNQLKMKEAKNKVVASRPGRQKETELEWYLKATPEQKTEYDRFKSAGKSQPDTNNPLAMWGVGSEVKNRAVTIDPKMEELIRRAKQGDQTADKYLKLKGIQY